MDTLDAAVGAFLNTRSPNYIQCSEGCLASVYKQNLCRRHFPVEEKLNLQVVPKAKAKAIEIEKNYLQNFPFDQRAGAIYDEDDMTKTYYGTILAGIKKVNHYTFQFNFLIIRYFLFFL